MLVFVPLGADEVAAWASGTPYSGVAYATTPTMLAAFGLDLADDEDAERTSLHIAALDALRRHGARRVAVASASAFDDGVTDLGAVTCGPLAWTAVSALFADAPEAGPAVAAAAAGLAGIRDLDGAWEHPAHEALLHGADLLWFGPEEWARLT